MLLGHLRFAELLGILFFFNFGNNFSQFVQSNNIYPTEILQVSLKCRWKTAMCAVQPQ